MDNSVAKKSFKKEFGQVNHFLITTLIGLDSIKEYNVTEKPSSFSTCWNPRDIERSVNRSRVFVQELFLGRAVECLEMYMKLIDRKPSIIESTELQSLFDRANISIYKKVVFIGDFFEIDPVLVGLMEFLITWRNRVFHYDIDNIIRGKSSGILSLNKDIIKSKFAGLDIERLKVSWENNNGFSFKETASFIKATHDFVSEVDKHLIANMNFVRYYRDCIEKFFSSNLNSKEHYISFVGCRRKKFVKTLLQNIANESMIEENIISQVIDDVNIYLKNK